MPEQPPVRQSPRGVLAVRQPRRSTGGTARPWTVVWAPAEMHDTWPGQPLSDETVALWATLNPHWPSRLLAAAALSGYGVAEFAELPIAQQAAWFSRLDDVVTPIMTELARQHAAETAAAPADLPAAGSAAPRAVAHG